MTESGTGSEPGAPNVIAETGTPATTSPVGLAMVGEGAGVTLAGMLGEAVAGAGTVAVDSMPPPACSSPSLPVS